MFRLSLLSSSDSANAHFPGCFRPWTLLLNLLSDLPNIPRLISLHYVPTPLLFPFNNCICKLLFKAHYITFEDINSQPYFRIACVKSVYDPLSSATFSMFHCPVRVWVIEQRAMILSDTVRSSTVMLPSDSFVSCLDSLLRYSTREFQVLKLIVLVMFGAVD